MTTNHTETPSTIDDLQREVRLLTAGLDRRGKLLADALRERANALNMARKQRDTIERLRQELKVASSRPRQPLAVENLEAAIRTHHARVTRDRSYTASVDRRLEQGRARLHRAGGRSHRGEYAVAGRALDELLPE